MTSPGEMDAPLAEFEAPARHSIWRPRRPVGAAARRSLRLRRIVAALLLVVLCALFYRILTAPFEHPQVWIGALTTVSTSAEAPPAATSLDVVPFQSSDLEAWKSLAADLSPGFDAHPLLAATEPLSATEMEAVGQRVDGLGIGAKDVLLLYIRTQGVVRDGEPLLHCSNAFDGGTREMYPLSRLLAQLRGRAHTATVLILDAGQNDADIDDGVPVNEFPRLVAQEVARTEDPRLWVVLSHGLLESSHVYWSRQRSVLVDALIAGLSRDADADANDVVDLFEWFRYASGSVTRATILLSNGQATQTPQLLWGQGQPPRDFDAPVIAPVARKLELPLEAEPVAAADDAQPAQAPTRNTFDTIKAATPAVAVSAPSVSISASANGLAVLPIAPAVPSLPVAAAPGIPTAATALEAAAAKAAASATSEPQTAPPLAHNGKAPSVNKGSTTSVDTQSPERPPATQKPDASPQDADPTNTEIAGLLIRGWELRDRLQQRGSASLTPIDVAPRDWRKLIDDLRTYEFLYRSAAISDSESAAADLRQIIAALSDLIDSRPRRSLRDPRADLWSTLETNSQLPPLSVPNVALAETLAGRGGTPLSPGVLTSMQALEITLQSPDRSALDKWLSELPPEMAVWSEFDVAHTLALVPDVSWPLLRDAISARIEGEQAAATWQLEPMIREPVKAGDELRLAAEQMLLDGVLADRTVRAATLLQQARQQYRDSLANARFLQRAREIWHDLSFQAPEYVKWCTETGLATYHCGPSPEDIHTLLASLRELGRRLQSGTLDDRDAIQIVSARLEQLVSRIGAAECARQSAARRNASSIRETPWQIQALLTTSLPTAEHRLHLLQRVTDVEALRLDTAPRVSLASPPPARSMAPSDWDYLLTCTQFHLELAQLSVVGLPVGASLLTTLESRFEQTRARQSQLLDAISGVTDDELFEAYRELGTEFARFRQKLATTLSQTPRNLPSFSSSGDIEALIAQSNAILHAERLMTATVPADALPRRPELRLQTAALLAFAAERTQSAAVNADQPRAVAFRQSARQLQHATDRLLGMERAIVESPSPLAIAAPPHADLMRSEQTFDVSVSADAGTDQPVRIVLEYDPDLIRVDGPPGLTLYREFELSANRARGVTFAAEAGSTRTSQSQVANPLAALPLPEADGSYSESWWASRVSSELRPTWTLSARRPLTFPLHIQRLRPADRPVRLVIKALTPDHYARSTVQFQTPAPAFADLQVAGIAGTTDRDARGIVLHPFPNAETEFRFQLVNLQQSARVVDVRLLSLSDPLDFEVPFATLTAAETADLLDRLRNASLAGQLQARSLAVAGAVSTEEEAAPEPPPDEPEDPKKPLPVLSNGGVIAVIDRKTQEAVFVPIRIEPQRPVRYVRPIVSYDIERERVEIVVRAETPDVMPPTGSSVHAEFEEALDDTATFQLDGVLHAPGYETRLFADVPAQAGKVAHLNLHVDGYPRAFQYAIPCDRDSTAVPLTVDALDIAVRSPARGTAVRTPVAGIPVSLQIDAPVGAFESLPVIAEVGLDLNRDRFLLNEPSIQLHSDREVDIRLKAFKPDGTLALRTRVSDFEVTVPAAGLTTVSANILARIQLNDRIKWSVPRETMLDGDPPQILNVELHPGRELSSEDKLRVVVRADDRNQSGTAAVELTFDVLRTGEFPPDAKIVPAGAVDSGAWVAEVPLADLPHGAHGLLVRAVDAVGNTSEVHREIVNILSAEAAAARMLRATAPVEGVALYGESPVPGATILLEDDKQKVVAEGRSEPDGRFSLPRVKPGPYKVKAEGLFRNKVRVAEADVEVPPPPKSVDAVRLQLR